MTTSKINQFTYHKDNDCVKLTYLLITGVMGSSINQFTSAGSYGWPSAMTSRVVAFQSSDLKCPELLFSTTVRVQKQFNCSKRVFFVAGGLGVS